MQSTTAADVTEVAGDDARHIPDERVCADQGWSRLGESNPGSADYEEAVPRPLGRLPATITAGLTPSGDFRGAIRPEFAPRLTPRRSARCPDGRRRRADVPSAMVCAHCASPGQGAAKGRSGFVCGYWVRDPVTGKAHTTIVFNSRELPAASRRSFQSGQTSRAGRYDTDTSRRWRSSPTPNQPRSARMTAVDTVYPHPHGGIR